MIAGVSFDRKNEKALKALGVKDSKLLSPKRREELNAKIEQLARDIVIINVSACKIDNMRAGGINLNRIEAMKFADALSILGAGIHYVDSPDVKPERLKAILQKEVAGEFVVEHKADVNYPVVAAASIVAKVARDKAVSELRKEFGDFGPGYSSNQITIQWMKTWMEKNKNWPDIVRRSWDTAIQIRNQKTQKGVGRFFRRDKDECKEGKNLSAEQQ